MLDQTKCFIELWFLVAFKKGIEINFSMFTYAFSLNMNHIIWVIRYEQDENGTLIGVDKLSISCFGFILNTFNTIFRNEIFPTLNVIEFLNFFIQQSAYSILYTAYLVKPIFRSLYTCTFTSALVPHWPNFLLIINSIRLVDLFKWARHSGF